MVAWVAIPRHVPVRLTVNGFRDPKDGSQNWGQFAHRERAIFQYFNGIPVNPLGLLTKLRWIL